MAEFFIIDITETTVIISTSGLTSGDVVRIFVRLKDDPDDATYDEKFTVFSSPMMSTIRGLSPGTDYLVNVGILVNVDGVNVTEWIGAQSFSTVSEEPDPERPEDWEWWNTIKSGREIRIEADEWNAFCERINEFRVYQGLAEYDFTYVESGDPISADIINEARKGLRSLPYEESRPDTVNAGDNIEANLFIMLAACLNSIP